MTEQYRKPTKKNTLEITMVNLTMLIALAFSGWMIYHFVKLAAVGIAIAIP